MSVKLIKKSKKNGAKTSHPSQKFGAKTAAPKRPVSLIMISIHIYYLYILGLHGNRVQKNGTKGGIRKKHGIYKVKNREFPVQKSGNRNPVQHKYI